MRKLILTVRGAVFQPSKFLDDFRMEAVHAGFIDRFAAGFGDVLVHQLAFFFEDLLDIGRMNATISHKPCQGAAGDLAPNGVETRDGDRFGGVIHDHVHASHLFKGADVAPVATNDATLHFFVGKGNQGGGHFGNFVGGHSLNGIGD